MPWAGREDGFTVQGKLMPATDSLKLGALLIGLTHGFRLRQPVKAGSARRWSDVVADEACEAVKTHRAMEAAFRGALHVDAPSARPN